MRTIHADLIAAQQAHSATPYVRFYINSVDYTSRVIAIEHIEEPYRESATIILTNSDRHFDQSANDLRGKSFSVGYGYNTATGNRYCGDASGSEGTPTLWVKEQSTISMEGQLVCILECAGRWRKLEERVATLSYPQPYLNIEVKATQTVYQLIETILGEVPITLTYESVDDIITTFHPVVTINPLDWERMRILVSNLIAMTKCFIRQIASGFEVVYPQDSDAVQETYYSNQAPYFKKYEEKKNLLVPNHIVVFCNYSADYQWENMIIGESSNAESIALYGTIKEYHTAKTITNQDDANKRAVAILTRYQAEVLAGKLVLPFHDCRVELYDKVKIYDWRGT